MSVHSFHDLQAHLGHDVKVNNYVRYNTPVNVSIECMDCNEVLLDFERDDDPEPWKDFPPEAPCECGHALRDHKGSCGMDHCICGGFWPA